MRTRPGMTLVEILVVITIVAVLVAITLPVLGVSRDGARRVASQANARSLAQSITVYTGENAGAYPAIEEGKLYPVGDGTAIGYPYWQVHETWPLVIAGVLPYTENLGVYLSPGSPRRDTQGGPAPWPSSYVYSTSFVGRPELWATRDTPIDEARARALARGARTHEVRFASDKALLWDAECGFLRNEPAMLGVDLAEQTPVAFADGSVRLGTPAEMTPAVRNPLAAEPVDTMRLHNTPDGVHGRDTKP